MLRLLAALIGGLLVGSIAVEVVTGDPDFSWMWPATLPFFIITMTLLVIGKSLRGANIVPDEALQALLDQHQGALARIKKIRRTGTSINDNPVCELTLVVAPADRDAYTTTTRVLIDQISIPRYQPGAVVVVARPDRDQPKALLVREPDETWQRRMVEEASRIPADHQAPEWAADPKAAAPLPGRKPIVSMGPAGRGLRITGYVALFAVGIGVVIAPNYSQFAWGVRAWTTSDFDNYVAGEQQQQAVDALVEVVGGDEFIELLFYEDGYVLAEAPSEPGATTVDDYQFRYGVAVSTGPTLIQPEDPVGSLFDVTEVDLTAIPGHVARAEELTGITDSESSRVHVGRDLFGDTDVPPIEIRVSLGNPYYDGAVTFDVNGAIVAMNGGVPGSESFETEKAGN